MNAVKAQKEKKTYRDKVVEDYFAGRSLGFMNRKKKREILEAYDDSLQNEIVKAKERVKQELDSIKLEQQSKVAKVDNSIKNEDSWIKKKKKN